MNKKIGLTIAICCSLFQFECGDAQALRMRDEVEYLLGAKEIDYTKLELAKTPMGLAEEMVQHTGYTASYNERYLLSTWVAYELNPERVQGTVERPRIAFSPDPDVTGRSATHYDYSNSGYSRGHMAPAADMKWSEKAMYESFYLTNVCPQKAELNTSMWNRLEQKVRSLAYKGNTLYICCGPIIEPEHKTIGESGVAIPSACYKAICMQTPEGRWHGIAFVFPNEKCTGGMFDYACTIDELEQKTGIDFFYNLSDDTEAEVEGSWHQRFWQ